MKQWYRIYLNRAFRGVDRPAFIYEKDIFSAYERYKRIKGLRKHTHPFMRMPDVSPVTLKQAARLERLIRKEGKITMM